MSTKKPEKWEKWLFGNANLKRNLPSVLVPESKISEEDEDLRDFFLTLGLIFNDLKGLVTINQTLKEVYLKPGKETTVSDHLGEFQGLDLQVLKYIQGSLYEALSYLKNKDEIFLSSGVQNIIQETPLHIQAVWDLLYKVATGNSIDDERFKEFEELKPILKTLRNHISFHYQSEPGKPRLIDGYRTFFFEGVEDVRPESRENAYRSTSTGNWDESRFYYSDAALQGYFINIYGGGIEAKKYSELVFAINSAILPALNRLLIEYHKTKVDNFS